VDDTLHQKILANGLKLLTRREHSQQELINKLSEKNYPLEVIREVIAELCEKGWQSDHRFTESYTRHRIKQGCGPRKIHYELRQKGIENADLTEIVQDVVGSWEDLLEQVYHKKYASDELITPKEWVKCSRFLQQRGFSAEMIQTLLKKLK
jgi:regulatory protein